MKQNIAIGASWMTSPISFIATANTPSTTDFSAAVCGVLTSINPTPKNSAKNITASTSLAPIAATKLSGMIATTASIPVFASPARSVIAFAPSAPSAIRLRASAGSTPAPGWSRFTTSRLTATEIAATMTV